MSFASVGVLLSAPALPASTSARGLFSFRGLLISVSGGLESASSAAAKDKAVR
ncbi:MULTISPECIES: hypothetical protein [unclassified Nostoc]|uniref:hypothetical protein n=1 Tax=unclassified Nostoc TaxID=2593658 RepID=UPI002AD2D011|nr:hypothetical protein [Nostoc sp. DedQUE03]MDZ7971477.1 hypothetical protein [Nostoc sp. DedQUE03]MDZ8046251.1 hypothetical protein [Nostoc sp. DedQUE02]